jgi:hypothetical protein
MRVIAGALIAVAGISLVAGGGGQRTPLDVPFEQTLDYQWLRKPVLAQRLLDDMEDIHTWTVTGKGEMSLATDPVEHGAHSLRISVPTRTLEDPVPTRYELFGFVQFTRAFNNEDWRGFNRLSVWVWPDQPGWKTINLRMILLNDGREKSPDPIDHNGWNSVIIPRNHAWNHVVWEIPSIPRDQVTGVRFEMRRQGNEPEASNQIAFYLDNLALERVQEDHYEGWNVAPGQIAYSQSGYLPSSVKTAIASGSGAVTFSLIRTETGEPVLTKPVEKRRTPLGEFEVMDFTEVQTPGSYWIRADPLSTPPFPIGADIWRPSLWKAINFFYGERCGTVIPGIHRECHRDWQCEHNGLRLLINGGWHDAGNLAQSTVNTSEATYAMFEAANHFASDRATTALAARFREEGAWGLDWLLKTSFGDGYRPDFSRMGMWTDGILGNNDDLVSPAANNPYNNFLVAAAEALGSRTLAACDPERAGYSRKMAESDWRFAMAAYRQTPDEAQDLIITSAGILASVELWELTADSRYRDQALALAPNLVNAQQKTFMPFRPAITGFFYTNSKKDQVLRFSHRGHEQAPVVALAKLCAAFPDDPHWMDWYSTVVLHSEYLKALASFGEPYRLLAASIYREEDADRAPENERESFRAQMKNGLALGGGYYLRHFPVWFDFRGNYGVLLSQTLALATAASLRGDPSLAGLAEQQLQWVVGRNPFVQSTMYGEGRLFCSLYSDMSGEIAGALPVGVETRGDRDIPYWPASNFPNWKEVWVHPVSRWMAIVNDLESLSARQRPNDVSLAVERRADGTLLIHATSSAGRKVDLRAWNLQISPTNRASDYVARVVSTNMPWIAVAIPDGQFQLRKEITGGFH